jgi:hypothetical protein
MNRLLASAIGLFGLASVGFSAYCSTTYIAGISGVTGLYNASDVQTTSTVDITSIRYTLEYDYTHTSPSTFPTYGYYNPLSSPNYWKTTVRVVFTNTNWQTAPAGSKFWVQVCNYIDTYDAQTNTSTLSTEADYFLLPNTTSLVTHGLTGYNSIKTFYDVNPRAIDISSLSVDSGDVSGKTGIISWGAWAGAPYPWTAPTGLMTSPTTIVGYADGSGTSFMGVVWGFARPTSNGTGGCSVTGRGITYPYVIPPDESPLQPKSGSLSTSLARLTPFDILSARRYI